MHDEEDNLISISFQDLFLKSGKKENVPKKLHTESKAKEVERKAVTDFPFG
jgi:hypothetical protein